MTDTIIRCSSTNNWPDCNRRAAADILTREIEGAGYKLHHPAPSAAAHVGSGVHAASGQMLAEKAASGTWNRTAAIDAGIEALHKRAEEEGASWDAPDVDSMNTAEAQVRRMSIAYETYIAPVVEPITVEQRLEADLGGGFILSGQSDNTAREPNAIRDTKTGAALRYYVPQIGGYGRLQRAHAKQADKGIIDFVPRSRLNKPQLVPVSVSVDIARAEAVNERIVSEMIRSITLFREGSDEMRLPAGDARAFIANPSSMLCSPKFCRAWGSQFCLEHKGATE